MDQIRTLSDIDLTLPLDGSEGISVNDTSRIRSQYLFAQHQAMVAQTQFADAKAAALMALIGLLALRNPTELAGPTMPTWFQYIYAGMLVISVCFCIMSIFPRYPSSAQRNRMADIERWSWPSLASDKLSATDYGDFMQTSEISQLIHSAAMANSALSEILLMKFRSLRIAFLFAIVALLLLTYRFVI